MSCNTVVHEVEGKPDHLMQFLDDYDTDTDHEAISKQHDLLIEILETFRADKSVRNTEY